MMMNVIINFRIKTNFVAAVEVEHFVSVAWTSIQLVGSDRAFANEHVFEHPIGLIASVVLVDFLAIAV